MSYKVQVIANIRSGTYFTNITLKNIQKYLISSGCEPVITLTRYKFHAKEIAIDAVDKDTDLIISIGGDGTINEIVNGLMEFIGSNKKLPKLGIISAGTGADLCRTLNIPSDYKKAIDIILRGKFIPIDIGRVRFTAGAKTWQRYFANVADIGLGGNVVRIANRIPKSLGGFLTFLISSLIGLLTYKPVDLKIYIDERIKDEGNITIIGAANGKYFGGGMKIAPMAEIRDGYLEILYVRNTNIFKFIKNVLAPVYKADHLLYKNLYHYRAKKLRVVAEKLLLVDIDGEEEKAQEVEISLIPEKIMIAVPV